MRPMYALGTVAFLACGGDAPTSPETAELALSKKAGPIELPSLTNPAVQTDFVCGPSYPNPSDQPPGFCSDITLLWLQPYSQISDAKSAKNEWYFAWLVQGEFPEDTLKFTYGVYHSPKPIFHHDGIYQFDALNVTVQDGRIHMEVSVRNSQPVNWGIFRTLGKGRGLQP